MAVTNTGIVERNITGVNESDLWLDTEATSSVSNTGVVERSITGVHDANFVRPLGDEEVTNGDFSNGSTDWALGGSTALVGGLVSFESITNTYSYIRQDVSSLTAKQYKIRLEVKNYVSGAVQVGFLDSIINLNVTTDGVYTAYTSPNADGSLFEVSREFNGGNFNFDIDNISVKEMLVNRESTATNTGIVERGVTGFNESVAFRQDTRTNLIPYSEDFSDASWTKSRCTITSNQAISPNGTLNADLMTSTDDDARLEDQVGSSGAEYTQSIYIKSAQVSDVNCQIDFAGLNIVTFTANQQWQRVETTLTDTSISPRLRLRILNSGNSIYVWGGQVEQQSYSTSYIPTSGAAVTVDNNSTSVVNNTGIVERPITGVNESDEMFPDNGTSSVVNIAEVIIPLLDSLEARATTFENREATQEILINLQKC